LFAGAKGDKGEPGAKGKRGLIGFIGYKGEQGILCSVCFSIIPRLHDQANIEQSSSKCIQNTRARHVV